VTEYTRYILNNYLWSMQDTSGRMLTLLNELRDEEEPVVVLMYGDHKPWLGDYESCYEELGIDVNVSKMKGMVNYYGTEYVIWANEAAKAVLGDEFTGEGPTVGVTFLMNELFAKLGWKGDAHMQMMEEVRSELQTVSSIGYYIDGNRLLFDLQLVIGKANQNGICNSLCVRYDKLICIGFIHGGAEAIIRFIFISGIFLCFHIHSAVCPALKMGGRGRDAAADMHVQVHRFLQVNDVISRPGGSDYPQGRRSIHGNRLRLH
jgi:hypothetical protein